MIQRLRELPAFPSAPAEGDAIFLTAFDPLFPAKQPDHPYVWIDPPVNDWVSLNVVTPVTDTFRTTRFPNRVKFTGRDFQTIEDEIIAILAENYGASFNDFIASDLGIMFLDIVSFAADNLAFYQDQQATEVYLDTAQIINNVIRLVRNTGFKVQGAVASTGDVDIYLISSQPFPVTIPAGFQLLAGNKIFQTVAPLTFPAGPFGPASSQSVGVVEGESVTESFTTLGTPNQLFQLLQVPPNKFVAENFGTDNVFFPGGLILLEVAVDGVTWNAGNFPADPTTSDPPGGEVSFLQLRPAHIYEVERAKTPPEVRFGDNVAGLIPVPVGAEVKVKYLATSGVNGNVLAGAINATRFPLIVGGNVVQINVTNSINTSGGANPQTADQVRPLARGISAAAGRAVSEEDYDAFSNNFPGVGIAKSLLIRGIEDDVLLRGLLAQMNTDLFAAISNTANPSTSGSIVSTVVGAVRTTTITTDALVGPPPTPSATITVSSAVDANYPGISGPIEALQSRLAGLNTSLSSLLNSILSSLCKANHVEILVLATDINGDYIAPSSVVLTGLESFIRSIGVFPVTVQGVDASPQRVPTNVNIDVKFESLANKVDLTQQIGTALSARLRGRQFGSNLRLSDLYDDTDLDGITFRDITVQVPMGTMPSGALQVGSIFLDGAFHAGDVILAPMVSDPTKSIFVITKGAVTVTDVDTGGVTPF